MNKKNNDNDNDNDNDKKQSNWLVILLGVIAALGGGGGGLTILFNSILGVGNEPPKAVIQVIEPPRAATDNRLSVFAGMELEFDAFKSDDSEDRNSLKTAWQLKRGDTVLDEVYEVMEYKTAPLEVGAYSLILTVEDSKGRKHSDKYRIDVNPGVSSGNSTSVEPQNRSDVTLTPSRSEDWWQPWDSNKGVPPEGTLIVSFEEEDTRRLDPIFLCRASDEDILKPGKVLSSGACYVSRYSIKDGTVNPEPSTRPSIPISKYEIFVPKGAWSWVSSVEEISPDRVVSADDSNRNRSVICRLDYGQPTSEKKFRQAKHPGILDQSINHCIFPWGEVSGFRDINDRSDTYEILVIAPGSSSQ